MVVVPTHTTRHLACCLASMLTQTHPPDAVCLSVDNAEPEILELARSVWARTNSEQAGAGKPPKLIVTMRPNRGNASLNQVRNNALRALDQSLALRDRDRIVVIDGDTALHPAALGLHRQTRAAITSAHRFDLTPERTDELNEYAIRQGTLSDVDAWTTLAQRRSLAERHKRHERQVWVRATPVARRFQKPHKPKLLGGHHAVRVDLLRAINGYDEAYVGYGYDDDDLAARLNQLRPRPTWGVLTGRAYAFHLWHPTRAPVRPTSAPGYAIFSQRRPACAQVGWDSPDEQDRPTIEIIGEAPFGLSGG